MGFKTISLSDEAYSLLKNNKIKGESFTDLVLRLLNKPEQEEILSLAGSWQGSEEESDSILKIIYDNRKNVKVPR